MTKIKINTAWFKERIAAKHMSQRQLANRIGIDPSAMSLTLRGRRKMEVFEAEQIANELGVPLNDVLENLGLNAAAGAEHVATVRGWVNGAGIVTMKRPAEAPWRVPTPAGMPEGTTAVRFHTEGATRGWLAFYLPGVDVHPDAVGRLCIIKTAEGVWHLRVPIKGYGKGTYTLVDLLGRGPNIDEVRLASATPVLWLKTSG